MLKVFFSVCIYFVLPCRKEKDTYCLMENQFEKNMWSCLELLELWSLDVYFWQEYFIMRLWSAAILLCLRRLLIGYFVSQYFYDFVPCSLQTSLSDFIPGFWVKLNIMAFQWKYVLFLQMFVSVALQTASFWTKIYYNWWIYFVCFLISPDR